MTDWKNNNRIRKWFSYFQQVRDMHISAHAAHACFFMVLSVFPLLVLMLGILRYTALHLRSRNIQTAAVLATDGTVQTGLYDRALKAQGICPIYPDPAEQKALMSLIYDCVKAGSPCAEPEKIRSLGQHLLDRGAQVLILGCTELPIAFAQLQLPFPTVDPTEILARAAVRFVGGKVKHPQAVR